MARMQREIMPEDWESRLEAMQEQSKTIEGFTKESRYQIEDHKLQLASNIRWTEYRSKNALFARISEIKKLKTTLEQYFQATKQEQFLLQDKLTSCEHLEQDLMPLEEAIKQCIQIRQLREEEINDKAHQELIKSKSLIKDFLHCLQNSSLSCREHLEILLKCAFDLESAITRQNETLKIDEAQLGLDWTSPNVCLKPFSITSSAQQTKMLSKPIWENFLEDLLKTTDNSLEKSRGLRGEVGANTNVVKQELIKQKETIEFALRHAIQTQHQMVEKLQWQQQYLKEEIAKYEKSLIELDKFKLDSVKPFKLTQSRLVNRNERSPLELCYDDAQHQLNQQMECLQETRMIVGQHLNHSRDMAHQLQMQLSSVNEELRMKSRTLEVDKRCLEISRRLQIFKFEDKMDSINNVLKKTFSTPEKFWERALTDK